MNQVQKGVRYRCAKHPAGRSGNGTRPLFEPAYYLLEGRGLMQVGDETRPVGAGDAVAIPPGAFHRISNTGDTVLKFLCSCAPGYEHDDTVLGEP